MDSLLTDRIILLPSRGMQTVGRDERWVRENTARHHRPRS